MLPKIHNIELGCYSFKLIFFNHLLIKWIMVQFRSSDRYCVHIGKTNLVQGSGKIMNRLLMLMCDTFHNHIQRMG